MLPPEVVLDRLIRTELSKQSSCSGYLGKLDINKVEPESFRSFLRQFQTLMNKALNDEELDPSVGVDRLPFHFDYLDVSDGTTNAHAFRHENQAFIVVTLPMIELLRQISYRLSWSPSILAALHLPRETNRTDLWYVVLQLQLEFLVSHEYTHHKHRHCFPGETRLVSLWTEFNLSGASGDITSQVQELDADGYATFLVLRHFLQGEQRPTSLTLLRATMLCDTAANELLVTCYLLAAMAFFCAFWQGDPNLNALDRLSHPLPPVRIKYVIESSEMFCRMNNLVESAWFEKERLQIFFRTAAQLIGAETRQQWDKQIAFLQSPEGDRYNNQLFMAFEAIRRIDHGPDGDD